MPAIPRIVEFTDQLVAIRRDLHAHPELGFEEVRTAGIVAEKLAEWGVEVHTGIGKTGVVGVLRGSLPGNRMIGLRADMDALPMEERTGLPFASTVPGKFHGCGHDVHTAMLLGAARYLSENRSFSGTVVFIFQPAEEGLGGARAMIADGLFDRFPCDEIYGMHNASAEPLGTFTIRPGKAMAGSDFFDIRIQGRGSHGAFPEFSRDPIIAGTHLVQAIQTIASRNVPALKPVVISVTQFHGGAAYNVVPDRVTLAGTMRYFDDDAADLVRTRLAELVKGTEAMFGVEIELEMRNVFDVLINDGDLSQAYADVAAQILTPESITFRETPVMGSEDFADMLKVRPGAYAMVGHGSGVPAHTPGFIVDESILPVGASLYARLAESRLGTA